MSLASFCRHPKPVSEFSNIINSGKLPEGLSAAETDPLPAFPTIQLLLSTGSHSGSLVVLESLDRDRSSTCPRCRPCRASAGPSNSPTVVFKKPGNTTHAADPTPALFNTRKRAPALLHLNQIHALAFISQSLRPDC